MKKIGVEGIVSLVKSPRAAMGCHTTCECETCKCECESPCGCGLFMPPDLDIPSTRRLKL